jgi:NAD(P)-dependent dehydrogenase (short-subunit alcohol dehydrogenase family)
VSDAGVFAGRAVLVTGAAKGIGRATAEAFGRAGARVGLLDKDAREVEAFAGALSARGEAIALTADVSDTSALTEAVGRCIDAFGGLDVLVNNAGTHFARAVDVYTEEEIDRLLAINFKGALYAIRSALPALRRSKGTIVSMSSMTAVVGQDRGAVYAATKGALISLTKALAIELAPDGIRVNCVCPAGVDTPLMRRWIETLPDPEEGLRQQGAMHLTRRMAAPEEIAEAVLFLASPAASFITGVALPVDGGATLGYRSG